MYLNVYYFLFQRKINNKKIVRGNIKRHNDEDDDDDVGIGRLSREI